ncbi:MAG: hypothetical protein AUG44_00030 [Actinobacteria bacterium 13_1_20CM_3_71_11]|nr:MAG: hypothetical protein AUG44_00030 [Actinobacteria bacterium 13_1_20CM_3_71_11]
MAIVGRPQQPRPHQRPGGEVEAGPELGVDLGTHRVLTGAAQIQHRQVKPQFVGDDRYRRAVDRAERGAQRLMPCGDAVERAAEGGDVQFAGQLQRVGQVVGGVAGHRLVEKPQPALGVGHHRRGTRCRHGYLIARGGAGRGRQLRGERFHGGVGEQRGQRDRYPERAAQPGHHLGGEEGVSAEREEIVHSGRWRATEDVGVRVGDRGLDRCSGRAARRGWCGGGRR